jgi:hypothetical protein
MKRLLRPRIAIPIALVTVLLVSAGLYLFQPWRIFTNTEVNEALPTATSAANAPTLTSTPTPAPSPSIQGQSPSAETTTQPEPSDEPKIVVLSEGEFISHEHATVGSARILQLPDGTRVLRIEGLDTSNGPDLKVWLTDQPVIDDAAGWGVFDDGKYVSLGELKGNRGNQNYSIPDDVDLSDFSSVSIWCERFSVSFGAAELQA